LIGVKLKNDTMAVKLEEYRGGKTRHTCPACGHRREFTRYVVVETGEYVADHVGRCNRYNKCGYHYTTKQYFSDNPNYTPPPFDCTKIAVKEDNRPVTFIPQEHLIKSMETAYSSNNFYWWLETNFGKQAAEEAFLKYMIGTSNCIWPGATEYWQIDINHNIRQCKMIQYNSLTGKRDRNLGVRFMGKKLLSNEDARLDQCFFGEHQLSEHPEKTIAVVEGESAAVVCSIAYPEMTWIATGGIYGCKWTTCPETVCKPLENRNVVLFPDLGSTDEWKQFAEKVSKRINCHIVVSEDLEAIATDSDRHNGLDIADFITRKYS
jgi:hypothetical protein